MKASDIFTILDLSERARQQGRTFNPCLVSAPGLGKSEIVHQWARKNGYAVVDIRTALLEAPDLIGYPNIVTLPSGKQKTVHATPDFLPESGKGILFLDEINRGTTSVMNCFMQLLTDRKIKDYTLPDGWLIVAAINPENELNDVNSMDTALKDRLEFFRIEYNKQVHVNFMESADYETVIRLWVESGTWSYVPPEEVSTTTPGAKYIAPRTLSKLNNAIKAGIPASLELEMYNEILGDLAGKSFFQFKNNEQPVTFEELTRSKDSAIERLKGFCNPKNYKTGHVSITTKSLIENDSQVTDELLKEVIEAIGVEQSVSLIREMEFKQNGIDIFGRLTKKYPDLAQYFKKVKKAK